MKIHLVKKCIITLLLLSYDAQSVHIQKGGDGESKKAKCGDILDSIKKIKYNIRF